MRTQDSSDGSKVDDGSSAQHPDVNLASVSPIMIESGDGEVGDTGQDEQKPEESQEREREKKRMRQERASAIQETKESQGEIGRRER